MEFQTELSKLKLDLALQHDPALRRNLQRIAQQAYAREGSIDPFWFLPIPVKHGALDHGLWVLRNVDTLCDCLGLSLSAYEAYLIAAACLIHDSDNYQAPHSADVNAPLGELVPRWIERKTTVTPASSADFALKAYGPCLPSRKECGIERHSLEADLGFLIEHHTVRQSEEIPACTKTRQGEGCRLDVLAAVLLLADALQRTSPRLNRDWLRRLRESGLVAQCETAQLAAVERYHFLTLKATGTPPAGPDTKSGVQTLTPNDVREYLSLWSSYTDKALLKKLAAFAPKAAYLVRLCEAAYMAGIQDINISRPDAGTANPLEIEVKTSASCPKAVADVYLAAFRAKVPEKAEKANRVFLRAGLSVVDVIPRPTRT